MGAPFKGVVYFNGEQPMVIDVNGKGGACCLAGTLHVVAAAAERNRQMHPLAYAARTSVA